MKRERQAERPIRRYKLRSVVSNDESNSLNNFAVSSDGIATALQDSASALMAGGNDLEQATAMIAAAMKNWLFIQKYMI